MSSPFPGMDPYIEDPGVWPGFHNTLITHIMQALNRALPQNYFAETDQRIEIGFLDSEDTRIIYPDVTVTEGPRLDLASRETQSAFSPATVEVVLDAQIEHRVTYVNIKTAPENRVVTVIELLSPINKQPGNEAFDAYLAKRRDMMTSRIHLVELDLLRKGSRLATSDTLPETPYYAFISPFNRRPYTQIWAIRLEDTLPVLPIPLLPGDGDVLLRLAGAFQEAYESAALDRRIDYTIPPLGPLTDQQNAYIDDLLEPLRAKS